MSDEVRWSKIKSYDDTLPEKVKKLISNLKENLRSEKTGQCPLLRNEGSYFYFCGHNLPSWLLPKFSDDCQIYESRLSVDHLSRQCMGDFSKCPSYKRTEEYKKAS